MQLITQYYRHLQELCATLAVCTCTNSVQSIRYFTDIWRWTARHRCGLHEFSITDILNRNMDKPIRKADVRSNSFESFARAKQAHQPILRNRRASISSYPERVRSSSICLSDDSWVYSPQQKVEWVDETKVNDCRGCHKPFSMIVRKHHCRNCGDVFCGACSSFKILLPNFNERQRVCAICITLLASDAPPRSPDAPGYPSELAVNTSLPDDLDDLFEEIIGNNEDFQQDPVVRPRRSVSSVSRPPRKLFSAGLPLPSSEGTPLPFHWFKSNLTLQADDESCTEQTTTITFGTDSFNKTLCALATISENQLNAGRDGTDSTDGDEPARKKSFSSLRPPRKSFSSSSPLKKSSLIMANGLICLPYCSACRILFFYFSLILQVLKTFSLI